jgi:class 3 adenylate cyclase/tetratricopeptide (TPR) repeat protein
VKCLKCQHQNPEDARFCNACAHALSPSPETKTPSIDFNRPHSYTPRFLADKILTTRSALEGERKQVTVLFADVAGFTSISEKLDPEQVHQVMDGCFKILMDEIHRHEGTINQFTGDGVMALFGAPAAIEDHARNACQAALAIQKAIKPYSGELQRRHGCEFKMRIGLNSGPVIVGSIGDDLRMDYTAIGDTTNLAARMESLAAPGTILISQDTHKRVARQFEFNAKGPVKVKGKENALDVYELIRERIDRPRLGVERQIFSEMVGRTRDLNQLELQINKAIAGEGSVVNVIGEAGIGKSRLIAEVRNSSSMNRVTCLEGRAISSGRNLSFHPVINLLKDWAHIKEEDSPAQASHKLETAIRNVCHESADDIFAFIATLMGMKLSGRYADRTAGIEGEALEKLIFKHMRDLLIRAMVLTPLMIVIEDLHWADISSIELLESLFRLAGSHPIVFINVFRPNHPETGDRIITTLKEKTPVYYVEIKLEPLTAELGETLIKNMLDIKGLSSSLISQIIDRSGGNPFFIEEVVRSFVDAGAVIRVNGEFKITNKIENMEIPHTVNDVLMARIDRLDEDTRDLVKMASVIGRSFFYVILTEVAQAIDDIDQRLSRLTRMELIRERQRMQELEYLFKHALAQEVAYESILSQKRKELHRKTADSIEKIFNQRLHEFFGILAYHYSNAGDLDKAEEYMLKAGEEALKISASNEALTYYKKALELYVNKHGDSVDKRKLADMEENIAQAFMNKGLYKDAVEYFDKAAVNRGENLHTSMFFIIPKFLINVCSILRNLYLPSIRKKKIPNEKENQFMYITMKKAAAAHVVDAKRCIIENAGTLAKAFKYDIAKSQSFFNFFSGAAQPFCVSGISLQIGRKIVDYSRKNMIEKNSDVQLYSYAFSQSQMVYRFYVGNWKNEIEERSINEALKVGDLIFATGQLLYVGYMKIELGDFLGCQAIIEYLQQIYEEYNFEHAESDVFALKSKLLMKKRAFFNARDVADQAIFHANKIKWYGRVIECLAIKTKLSVRSGNLEDAKEIIKTAQEVIKQMGKETIFIDWYCLHLMGRFDFDVSMLENALIAGKQDAVRLYRTTALKSGKAALSLTRKKVAAERTESYKLIGRYYWLTGKQDKAIKWWDKAIKEGERLNARPELSRTYFEVASRLLEPQSKYYHLNGTNAKGYLEKARKFFKEIGLERDMDDLEQLQADHGLIQS